MKIAIADDERLIRLSLRSMIEDIKIHDCTIIECKNGKELIEVVKSIKPEIVFADIKMPIFSGLEAIENCMNFSKDTQFILTTGFSEFEYAKKAIQLGVYDYLIKPIEPVKLNEIINNIVKENKQRLYEKNLIFQKNIMDIFYSDYVTKEDVLNELYHENKFTVCTFYLDNNLDNNNFKIMKQQILSSDEEIINEIIYNNINIAKLRLDDNLISFVFSYYDENFNKINKYINKLIVKYKNNNNLYLTTITGNKLDYAGVINSSIEEHKKYGMLRIILGIEKNYNVNEFIGCEINENKYLLSNAIENISNSFKNKMFFKFCESIDKLERILIGDKNILKDSSTYRNINLFLNKTIDFQSEEKFSNEWISQIQKYKNKFDNKFDKSKDITEKIMEFIDQNYMFEISITNLSEKFNLTPNYISSLFHKKTKMRILDYIAKVRISKAQSLLIETDLNVKDISEAVGYRSTRYFTNLFKSSTGETPSEYRKKLQSK